MLLLIHYIFQRLENGQCFPGLIIEASYSHSDVSLRGLINVGTNDTN